VRIGGDSAEAGKFNRLVEDVALGIRDIQPALERRACDGSDHAAFAFKKARYPRPTL